MQLETPCKVRSLKGALSALRKLDVLVHERLRLANTLARQSEVPHAFRLLFLSC